MASRLLHAVERRYIYLRTPGVAPGTIMTPREAAPEAPDPFRRSGLSGRRDPARAVWRSWDPSSAASGSGGQGPRRIPCDRAVPEVDPLQGIIKDVTRWLRNAVIPRSGANCCTISPDFGEISFYDVGQIWARAARSAGPECLCGRVLTSPNNLAVRQDGVLGRVVG